MGEVGDGSMTSPQEIKYLPSTENEDGSMGVDLSNLENPDTVSASVDCVARYCRSKNKKLLVKVPREYFSFIALLSQMGFRKIDGVETTYIVLREDQSDTILCANDLHEVASGATLMQRGTIPSSRNPCSSQTPGGATLAAQSPSETACEQGPEFQQSRPGDTEFQDPEIKQRFEHPLVADLPSSADCLEETDDKPDSESGAMDIPTDEEVLSGESGASVESHTEVASADSHGPRTEPSRKRSAASVFDEDSLFAKIRRFVNQQIEEALLPLISALRSRDEDEHKHRQKMLALEQEKLALMRQKLECTRRSNAVPASVAELRKPPSGNFEARPSQSGSP